MTPIVNGLETEYQGQLAVQRIDANQGDGPAIVDQYSIRGHPTLLLIDREGTEIDRLLGPQAIETLEGAIEPLITATQ